MLRIGLSVNEPALASDEFLQECHDKGLSVLEVSLAGRNVEGYDFEGAAKRAAAHGVELWSVHLQFYPFEEIDPSSLDEEIRTYTVEKQSEVIRAAGKAGITHFVIHPSIEPIGEEERRARMAQARKSLKELAQAAEEAGGVLCVEDLPRTCLGRSSWDILELLKADDRLRCCFDTNHLLGEYIPNFIRNVGSLIATTHISDYDFWNERHVLPGEGEIDWKELYDELMKAGYDGVWLYEINPKGDWCVVRPRDLTIADFVNNAHEIFEGKAPTPVGHLREDMTFWEVK